MGSLLEEVTAKLSLESQAGVRHKNSGLKTFPGQGKGHHYSQRPVTQHKPWHLLQEACQSVWSSSLPRILTFAWMRWVLLPIQFTEREIGA